MSKRNLKSAALLLSATVLSLFVALQMARALVFDTTTPFSPPVGFVAADAVTNTDFRSGAEVLFRVEYHREFWDGDLVAYHVDSTGDVSTATQPWTSAGGGNAAFQLDTRSAARIIVTRNTAGTNIPFTWTDLDSTQQSQIIVPAAGTVTPATTASDVVSFLRGVRTKEVQQGGNLRQRASPLGDIIHSRPRYVADATAPTVFVGANDGMLHAFDATTGAERWAYIPSMLISKLSKLSVDPVASGTAFGHDYYVDGSAIHGLVNSGTQRLLVGGLGAGGKGLFGLDITGSARLAPADEATAKNNILWEITSATSGFSSLGYTYSTPVITKINDKGTVKDVVVIGNGYNNSGDYKAHLFIINALSGSLLYDLSADTGSNTATTGTSASPNGLSSPSPIDDDHNGTTDWFYAGDVNGTMWKFDLRPLAAAGSTSSSAVVSALLTTNPVQPITMKPAVGSHPNGGYMVNFATGASLKAADASDTSTYYAYGIWDGKPAANDTLLTQTLTERCYTAGTTAAASPCASRVRTATANMPDWSAGAGHHKGWKVALPGSSTNPGGEKVVGDTSFTNNVRFYFTSYNPNASSTVSGSPIKGENWLMELNSLNGGVMDSVPFLDMNGDVVVDSDDLVKSSAIPPAPVTTTDGVPVGKFLNIGVMSQPILVQLSTLNNTLYNQNPDVAVAATTLTTGTGVVGGHFDVDFFHTTPTGGSQASFTITVGSSGQSSGFPATLGTITVDGVVVIPALTVLDVTDGTATATNATTIKNRVMNGFTATASSNVVTILAPIGTRYNGKTVTVNAGTSQSLVQGVAAVAGVTGVVGVAPSNGSFTVTDVNANQSIRFRCNGTYFGQNSSFTSSSSSTQSTRLNALYTSIVGTINGYTTSCTKVGSPTSSLNCSVAAPVGVTACASGFTIDNDVIVSSNVGPQNGVDPVTAVTAVTGVPQSGWTNFKPALTVTNFNSNGTDSTTPGDTCAGVTTTSSGGNNWGGGSTTTGTDCKYDKHIHQYDDSYDVTGVNMLNPSDSQVHINLGLSSMTTDFKVLVHNQYLSPAVKLHIGDPSYRFDLDYGYIPVKNYQTSATLDLADYQTYRRDPNVVWTAVNPASPTQAEMALPKTIGSLAFNMPLNALDVKDWWGNGDLRVGLMPMQPQCMWQNAGTTDGNMYMPVIPPTSVTTDGPGTAGWNSTTTPATATGARHGGALIVQLIRANTPNTAIELNVAGRPEFGWRVKSALFSTYVLAEWGTYWHHPNGKCYYSTGWTKTPPQDKGSSSLQTKATGSTDPHLGNLSAGGGNGSATITSSVTTVVGSVTTTTVHYSDGSVAKIVRTVNVDGTVTIVTTDALGVVTTQTIANTRGKLVGGGDERGTQAQTGRISWREVVAP